MREAESKSRAFAKTLRSRMTDAETILWSQLREWRSHGLVFRRQHPIGPYIADFASVRAKLVVELDGGGHGADDQIAYDKVRDEFLRVRGWRVVRITNDQVFKDLDTVLRVLAVQAVAPPPRQGSAPPPLFGKACGSQV
jgi:very-short-patch-repair endonuclease